MKKLVLCLFLFGFAKPLLAAEITEIAFEIDMPNPCHSILISDVYGSEEKTIVIVQIVPPSRGTSCISMIGKGLAKLEVKATIADEIEYVVMGKAWCWESISGESTGYIFPRSQEELNEVLQDMVKVFSQDLPSRFLPPADKKWHTCPTQSQ